MDFALGLGHFICNSSAVVPLCVVIMLDFIRVPASGATIHARANPARAYTKRAKTKGQIHCTATNKLHICNFNKYLLT